MIDTDEKFLHFLPHLRAAEWIALDTEADSLHAYPEKLCLIQVSIAGEDRLIDPLAKMDLNPLWPELKKHQLIMHGADYDLRLFRKNHAFVPERIFDTMIAARLLGVREFGLNSLVNKFLGVHLEKGSQKADWARRPLTPRMEAYARNDTHHLKALSDMLKEKLREKNRLSWLEESCARLIIDCSQPSAPEPDRIWRVKGSHTLNRLGLAILRELWRWREQEALASNRPPFFVLQHETLVSIASAVSANHPYQPLLPGRFSPRRWEGVQNAIEAALAILPSQHPEVLRPSGRRQTEPERIRFEKLEKIRNRHATQLEIDPTLIASRMTLILLAYDWEQHQGELMDWQKDLLKNDESR
jgi:ribonuclease D